MYEILDFFREHPFAFIYAAIALWGLAFALLTTWAARHDAYLEEIQTIKRYHLPLTEAQKNQLTNYEQYIYDHPRSN